MSLMAEWCRRHSVEVWAYSLMPNHVHLIALPTREDSLRKAIGEAHRRYTLMVNKRMEWTGHLWQGRFYSFPMDYEHLITAARYIEMNPVRAGLVDCPEDYPWSSARAHLCGKDDKLVRVEPLLNRIEDWGVYLTRPIEDNLISSIRSHERTGRPLGSEDFISGLEVSAGRKLRPQKVGRKGKK